MPRARPASGCGVGNEWRWPNAVAKLTIGWRNGGHAQQRHASSQQGAPAQLLRLHHTVSLPLLLPEPPRLHVRLCPGPNCRTLRECGAGHGARWSESEGRRVWGPSAKRESSWLAVCS